MSLPLTNGFPISLYKPLQCKLMHRSSVDLSFRRAQLPLFWTSEQDTPLLFFSWFTHSNLQTVFLHPLSVRTAESQVRDTLILLTRLWQCQHKHRWNILDCMQQSCQSTHGFSFFNGIPFYRQALLHPRYVSYMLTHVHTPLRSFKGRVRRSPLYYGQSLGCCEAHVPISTKM